MNSVLIPKPLIFPLHHSGLRAHELAGRQSEETAALPHPALPEARPRAPGFLTREGPSQKGPESAWGIQETMWKGQEKADPHCTSRGQACVGRRRGGSVLVPCCPAGAPGFCGRETALGRDHCLSFKPKGPSKTLIETA